MGSNNWGNSLILLTTTWERVGLSQLFPGFNGVLKSTNGFIFMNTASNKDDEKNMCSAASGVVSFKIALTNSQYGT